MIYITGDVHSRTLNNWEQKIAGPDVKVAKRYLEILKKYRLTCTLFINGECLDYETADVKDILKFNVELGGHTYDNFKGRGKIRGYLDRKIFGCIYGSKFYQEKDIEKTRKSFEKIGLKMICWRTHAFNSNEKTFKILKEAGVRYVSDLVGDIKPFAKEVFHVPINIPIDQNTISYGRLKPENRDPFASCVKGRISAEEWFEIIKKRIKDNEKNKIDSIILIHPETMAVLDNFGLFEKIAKFLSKYKSKKISEIKNGDFLKNSEIKRI